MTQFRMLDTKKADGFYVSFERVTSNDPYASPEDYLFQDPDYQAEDQARLDAWRNDDWHFIGIQAKAVCLLVRGNVGTCYTLTSPGIWGIESDSGEEYLQSEYEDQIAILKSDIEAMNKPIYSE